MEFLASSKDHDSMDDKGTCKNETTWCCVIGTYRNILCPRFKCSVWIQWSCWQSMFTLHMLPFPCSDVLSLHAMGASNIINATESGWLIVLGSRHPWPFTSQRKQVCISGSVGTSSLSLGSSYQWWHTSWQYLDDWLMFGNHFWGWNSNTGLPSGT